MTAVELWLYWTSHNHVAPPMFVAEDIVVWINEAQQLHHSPPAVSINDKGDMVFRTNTGWYTIYAEGRLRPITTMMMLAFARRYQGVDRMREWAQQVIARYQVRKWRRTWQ